MAGSVNKVILIGNLGNDPEVRAMQSGDKVVNLSIATSESWKDKSSGERRENTQWHRVVIFNQGLVNVAQNYLKKGAKVYIEGQLETRSWDDPKTGEKKYATEVVLRPFRGELTMLDSKGGGASSYNDGGNAGGYNAGPSAAPSSRASAPIDEMEDESPF
ncbi:MAG: single-stranded DNA-binding protein [Alphaproteobacteria bacterium]|nr:single-stranded DNA-binding protein [Alphaproteobacteria bacterium]